MAYSRADLLRQKTLIEEQAITQDLVDRLFAGEKLTVAEGRYICGRLELFKSGDPNVKPVDALDYPPCVDYIFMDKYLIYFKNFEGWDYQEDAFGEIPIVQKLKDVAFLDHQFTLWQADVIENTRLRDELLRHVQIETYRQLKALKEYCKQVGYGWNRYKHLAKGIALHSKFVYITILEYYQDGNPKEKTITICNRNFLIDSFAYVHILFRHYAAQVKEHQQDKSYHAFGDFDYKKLPDEIFDVLNHYSGIADCNSFDEEKVFLKFHDQLYAIWYKKMPRQLKGMPKTFVYRVETLYPVEAKRDLDKIADLKEAQFSATLSIFQ
jgi:hypothetical protein